MAILVSSRAFTLAGLFGDLTGILLEDIQTWATRIRELPARPKDETIGSQHQIRKWPPRYLPTVSTPAHSIRTSTVIPPSLSRSLGGCAPAHTLSPYTHACPVHMCSPHTHVPLTHMFHLTHMLTTCICYPLYVSVITRFAKSIHVLVISQLAKSIHVP